METVAWTESVMDIRNSVSSKGSLKVTVFNHETGTSMQPDLSLNIDVTTKVRQCFGDKISAEVLPKISQICFNQLNTLP